MLWLHLPFDTAWRAISLTLVRFILSLLGFLSGVTLAGGVGYYYLLEEYNSASASLLNSVQELQSSTEKASIIKETFCLRFLLMFLHPMF